MLNSNLELWLNSTATDEHKNGHDSGAVVSHGCSNQAAMLFVATRSEDCSAPLRNLSM